MNLNQQVHQLEKIFSYVRDQFQDLPPLASSTSVEEAVRRVADLTSFKYDIFRFEYWGTNSPALALNPALGCWIDPESCPRQLAAYWPQGVTNRTLPHVRYVAIDFNGEIQWLTNRPPWLAVDIEMLEPSHTPERQP